MEGNPQAPFISGLSPAAGEPLIRPDHVCSTNQLAGFRVLRPLGLVRGITVRSRNMFATLGGNLKSLVGGEIGAMTTLCEDAREEAYARMCESAGSLGATAIVAMRYDTNSIADGVTEVVAYGLALTDGRVPCSAVAAEDEGGLSRNVVATANELPNYPLEHHSLGVVQGLTVRSRNVFASVGAGLKSLVGGEISTYTSMCEEARLQAYQRMVADAAALGADAIIGMRYDTNEIVPGVTEVLAYGTALSSTASSIATIIEPSAGGDARFAEVAFDRSLVTTANRLPGSPAVHSLGMVQGITVRSNHIFANVAAGLKSLVGGEIATWSGLCQEARRKAFERLLLQARERGAQGVVAVRYDCNQIQPGKVEVIAYGTAVSEQPDSRGSSTGTSEDAVPNHCVTTDVCLAGQEDAHTVGIARGVAVFTVNLVRNIGAGLKGVVGGEIRNYLSMCEAARAQAFRRMLQHGAALGGTGIVCARYTSHCLIPGVIEVVAYGTAVRSASVPPVELSGAVAAATSAAGFSHAFASTANELAGVSLPRMLGIVRGITVRSRNVFTNIGAGVGAAFMGGEVDAWTKLCDDAREEAMERMVKQAVDRGAQAVLGLRFESNEISPGMTEVLAYGTAVTAGLDANPPLFGRG